MGTESLVVYVNGEYVPRDQARISIFDVGFLRGDAVFDTTSAWNGRIFYGADEVFMTSTAGGIMPLVEVDGRPIGAGKPGPVTERLYELYWALRESGRHGTPIFPERAG